MADTADGIDLYADVDEFGADGEFDSQDLYDDVLTASSSGRDKHRASSNDSQKSLTTSNYHGKRFSLYVGNLTWWTSDQDITNSINVLGVSDIIEIKFYENRANGQSKGFCLVVIASEHSYRTILNKLGEKEIHGQTPLVTNATKYHLNQFEQAARKDAPQQNGSGNGETNNYAHKQENFNKKDKPQFNNNQNRPPSAGKPSPVSYNRPPQGAPPGPQQMPIVNPIMGPQIPNGPPPGFQGPPPGMAGQAPRPGAPHVMNMPPGMPHPPGGLPPPPGGMPPPGGLPPVNNIPQNAMPPHGNLPHGVHPPAGVPPPGVPPPGPRHQGPPQMGPRGGHPGPQGGRPHMGQDSRPHGPNGLGMPPVSGPPPHMPPNIRHGIPPQGLPPPGIPSQGPPPGMPPHAVTGNNPQPHVNPAFFPNTSQPPPGGLPPVSSVSHSNYHHASEPYRQSSIERQETTSQLSDTEFEEILQRNKTVSSSAISRAVQDASAGEYASAIETLVTAISLIKQSKIANDDRCKILISSLQDTLHGIESKSYGSKGRDRGRSRSRERERDPERREKRRRERSRSREREYRERSREREREPRSERESSSRTESRHYTDSSAERHRERERERTDRERVERGEREYTSRSSARH